jgi:hypothetical protein
MRVLPEVATSPSECRSESDDRSKKINNFNTIFACNPVEVQRIFYIVVVFYRRSCIVFM